MLSEATLRRLTDARGISPTLFVTAETGSTNNDAKAYAETVPQMPALFVTDRQTAGRGRQGKSFVSPPGGLYMSLLLPAELPSSGAVGVTGCAAVAVCRAVEACAGVPARIKWVNDILIRKGAGYGKAAGILCEATESGGRPYLVIGIGLNVTDAPVVEGANFPPAALFPSKDRDPGAHEAETLCACLTEQLLSMAADGFRFPAVSAEYRSRSMVTGRVVDFTRNGIAYSGTVRHVNDDGSLTVNTEAGPVLLDSGEISVRIR